MSRLDRLFDSLNEPKDSTNGLRGKVCGAGQLLRVKREAFRAFFFILDIMMSVICIFYV